MTVSYRLLIPDSICNTEYSYLSVARADLDHLIASLLQRTYSYKYVMLTIVHFTTPSLYVPIRLSTSVAFRDRSYLLPNQYLNAVSSHTSVLHATLDR